MDDDMEDTKPSEVEIGAVDPSGEIGEVLSDIEVLLKNGDVIASLTARGVNASLALLVLQGLGAYLSGRKAEAADDLSTAVEEIRARLSVAGSGEPGAAEGAGGGRP